MPLRTSAAFSAEQLTDKTIVKMNEIIITPTAAATNNVSYMVMVVAVRIWKILCNDYD